jgi:cardiolipin synthase A/B
MTVLWSMPLAVSGVAAEILARLESLPFVAAHLAAFALVTLHCLRHRREPTSALLWIAIAWSLPVVGAVLYLAFGVNRVPTKGWHKHRSDQEFLSERRLREEEAMPLAYWRAVHEAVAAEPDAPFAHEINRVMDTILPDHPLLGGSAITTLVTGDEAYPPMLEAIRSARHHVHLQTFILDNDETGTKFLDALAKKAREGVTVRLLYDHFGSTHAWLHGLFRQYRGIECFRIASWTQANPIKRQFQINLRNHRKTLVVDGRAAFMGGLNISNVNVTQPDRPADRDYHFEIRGPMVQELQYSFLRDWYFMTDENPEVLLSQQHFPRIEPAGKALMRIVHGGPTAEVEHITDVFFAMAGSARRQLLVVTPYLAPTADLIRAFRAAALRGVDVRLILPKDNNHVYAGMAGRALYDELLVTGVRIFERHGPFLHAKAMIADDAAAMVGTANLDVRSLRLNYETNLVVYDPTFVDALKRVIVEDLMLSEEVSLAQWRTRPLRQQMAENFCHLLTPML